MNSLRLLGALLLLSGPALAANVGDELPALTLKDVEQSDVALPDFGKKVLAIFYTDADVADMNDPLADAIKAKDWNLDLYRGIGVANLKDSKAPNFLIRKIIKGKIEKYKSTIVTDPEHLLPTGWGLGEVNNTSVVLILGKDKKLKHVQRGPIRGADIDTIVALLEKLMTEG